MNKNLIAFALTLTLSASTALSYAAAPMSYTDVGGNWAQSDINNMLEQRVMTGYSDGLFHPNAWVNRRDFSEMTARSLGLAPRKADSLDSIRAVDKNQMGFGPVTNPNWISSYPTGVYRPSNPVRRVEMLSAAAGTLNKPYVSDSEATEILSHYTDAASVPEESRVQTATAIKYNLFEINPQSGANMIEPLRPATRDEVAAVLNNLHDNQDISLVQNGQVIAAAPPTTEQTSGTAAVKEENTSTTSAATQPDDNQQTNASGSPVIIGGYSQMAHDHNWLISSSIPYRNSADTIPEFRNINATAAPNNTTAKELETVTAPTLAANTTFTGTVAKALYSEFNRPGDPVMLILDHAILDANGRIVAPAGSKVLGVVTSAQSHNITGKEGQLGLAFNAFITPDGQRIPMSASLVNADGILKADDLQGIAFHPDHSVMALRREINTSEGSYYGSKFGKLWVLEQPFTEQLTDRVVDPRDKRPSNIVIGVGDRLHLKMDSVGVNPVNPSANTPSNTNNTTTQ